MNQLRSWLYGHDSSAIASSSATAGSTNDPWPHVSREDQLAYKAAEHSQGTDKNGVEAHAVADNTIRSKVLKVIPLAPGDCLECKLVGTGVMMLSGVIVITSAMTRSHKVPLVGPRKTLYYGICGGLFCAFEAAAICRLFDLGPFRKSTEKQQDT